MGRITLRDGFRRHETDANSFHSSLKSFARRAINGSLFSGRLRIPKFDRKMWMADHLANNWMNEAFNTNYARIPLKGGATILHDDALEADWAALLPPENCSYVMGNPPFIGAQRL